MAQKFKEVAHLRTDLEKYGENYDRIFNKKDSNKVEAKPVGESHNDQEQRIKELNEKLIRVEGIHNKYVTVSCELYEKLKLQNEIMREALCRISEIGYYHDYGDHRKVATEALEKIGEV